MGEAIAVEEVRESPPVVLSRPDHSISRRNISRNALKVLYRLDRFGHEACLVGGSVRDLMLGRRPKDFDVATDARPHEVRKLFRNSRIIGRRFRLVHVYFRDGIIEVSTFRAEPDPDAQQGEGELLVTDDNVFGSAREDAFRRDFTVNALFYRIADFSVVDFVGGVEDLEARLIRAIGDPDVRFREDPVRMMRACELAARLRFGIEDEAQAAMGRRRDELQKASPARLIEELLEMLRCGATGTAFQWMLELGLADVMLPELEAIVAAEAEGLGSFGRVLPIVDRLVKRGREVSDTLLLAVLLAPSLVHERHRRELERGRPLSRRQVGGLIEELLDDLGGRFSLSNARARRTAGILEVFQRLCEAPPMDWKVSQVTRHPSYEEGIMLFEILIDATGEGRERLEAWREAALEAAQAPRRRKRKRRSRSRARHRRH